MVKEGTIILSNYIAELHINLGENIKCEINKINKKCIINGINHIVADVKILEGSKEGTILKDIYIPITGAVNPKQSKKKKKCYIKINEIDVDFSSIGTVQRKILTELIDVILPIRKNDDFDIAIIDFNKQRKEKDLILEIIDDLSNKTIELETKEGIKVYYSLLSYSLQEDYKCIVTMDWIKDTREDFYINYFNLVDKPIELVVNNKTKNQKEEFWMNEFIRATQAEFNL